MSVCQFENSVLIFGVIGMNYFNVFVFLFMGENSPFPPGIPKEACWIFRVTSWKCCNGHCFLFYTFFSNLYFFKFLLHWLKDKVFSIN